MKNIFLVFLFIIGIFSCTKIEKSSNSIGIYQTAISHQSTGITSVGFTISYDTLFKWIGAKKGKVLYQSQNDQNGLFPIKMIQDGLIEVVSTNGNLVQLNVPIAWEAEPRLSGISAGIVKGKILLQINSKLDLLDYQNIRVKETVLEYRWIEKPSVKVMGFGINVTGLIDQMIQSKKSMIVENINQYANQALKINQWEKSINNLLKPVVFQDFVFHNYNTSIDFVNLSINPKSLSGIIRIKSHVELLDNMNPLSYNLPVVARFEKLKMDTISNIDFNLNLSFNYLKKLFDESLKKDYPSTKVNFEYKSIDSTGIICNINGLKGKKSQLSLKLLPTVKSMNKLGIVAQDVRLSGLSFPSSLLNKYIKRRIQQQLNNYEFDLSNKVQDLLYSNNLVETKDYQLKLNALSFNKQSVNLSGKIFGQYSLKK